MNKNSIFWYCAKNVTILTIFKSYYMIICISTYLVSLMEKNMNNFFKDEFTLTVCTLWRGNNNNVVCASSSHTHTYQKTYIVYRHPQKFFLTQKIRVRTFFQSSKTMRKHYTNSTIVHDIVYNIIIWDQKWQRT